MAFEEAKATGVGAMIDDLFDEPDYDEGPDDEASCPWCGGDGVAEYLECPEAWGEDCPSEENHIITCPQCKGSGLRKDCSVQ